jgi:hypothetical protein
MQAKAATPQEYWNTLKPAEQSALYASVAKEMTGDAVDAAAPSPETVMRAVHERIAAMRGMEAPKKEEPSPPAQEPAVTPVGQSPQQPAGAPPAAPKTDWDAELKAIEESVIKRWGGRDNFEKAAKSSGATGAGSQNGRGWTYSTSRDGSWKFNWTSPPPQEPVDPRMAAAYQQMQQQMGVRYGQQPLKQVSSKPSPMAQQASPVASSQLTAQQKPLVVAAPHPQTLEEAAALPPGTVFVWTDGSLRKVPNR